MFLTIFILFTLLILITAFVISSLLTRTYVVTANGTVTTEDNTFVGSFADGILVELIHEEGSFVEFGDVLFTVSSGNEGLQYQILLSQLEQQESLLVAMDLFEKSLNDSTNHMQNTGIEQEYYARVEHYLKALEEDRENLGHIQEDLDDRRQRLATFNQEINRLGGEIDTLNTRESSLRTQLENAPQQPNGNDENSEEGTYWTVNPEVDRLQQELDAAVSDRERLQAERDGKISEREGIEADITHFERRLSETTAGQTKINLLAELGASRTAAETRITELEGQVAAHQVQDGLYEVRANHTGYIHYLIPLREGMMIQRMQTIAEISENREDQMQVEVFIEARNISKVEIGQDVNVAIDGVNIQKYRTMSGTLASVDIGTMAQETEQGTMIFYRGIVTIHETQLEASNGDVVQLLKSMPVTARIVYERETYLDWILSLLNFRNH